MIRNRALSIRIPRVFLFAAAGPFAFASYYLYREAKLWVRVKPLSSIPYVIPSILVVKILYMMIDTAEVPIPNAVL
jgi:hypothetical protein